MAKQIIEMVKYRNFLHRALADEIRAYNVDEQDLLLNPRRRIRTQRMSDLKKLIREMEPDFRENATFKTDEFTSFMVQFLTLTEGNFAKTKFRPVSKDGELGDTTYYVISSPETKEALKETIKTDVDLAKFISGKSPEDVTKLRGDYIYPFKKNLRMKDKFARYDRLKIAIYELMQLKMDNPEITDKERYQIVLENTVMRNLKRSDNIIK